jgi:hypothetical protein
MIQLGLKLKKINGWSLTTRKLLIISLKILKMNVTVTNQAKRQQQALGISVVAMENQVICFSMNVVLRNRLK